MKLLLDTIERFPDKQLVIKIRPFDPVDIRALINGRLKSYPNVFIIKDANPWALINCSSLVITSRFSSIALDALLLDKPVITLNFYKRKELIPFAKRGVALNVDRPGDLYGVVKQVFEDDKLRDRLTLNRKGFIYDYGYKIDGKSEERIVDLIKKMYSESI